MVWTAISSAWTLNWHRWPTTVVSQRRTRYWQAAQPLTRVILTLPPPDFDQRGNPRVTDGNADGTARIDIGAFEVLRGDLNGDGEINGLDVDPFIDILLDGPPSATADLNADGSVNGLDVDPFVAEVVGGAGSVWPLGGEHALNNMDVGLTGRQLHHRRPAHESNRADDPAHLTHRRTSERVRWLRLGGNAHRSSPRGMDHQVAADWQATVDRALSDGDDWLR